MITLTPQAISDIAPYEVSDALERGAIVHFPECPIALASPQDLDYLRDMLPRQLSVKNVSYHPESDRTHGVRDDSLLRDRAHSMLKTHSQRVLAFLEQLIPSLIRGCTVGTSSFRPIQERGRDLKPHASNELIHIDAGAYGATDGDRILRFFVNVNPQEDRVWASKGTFAHLYQRYGGAAGITDAGPLRRGLLDKGRTGLLRAFVAAGVKEAMVVDSSPYDRVMRKFHNFMKDSPSFQSDRSDYRELRFAPFSAWMVLTDGVSHASVSGQHALVNTFLLRLEACRMPQHAPINILRTGTAS